MSTSTIPRALRADLSAAMAAAPRGGKLVAYLAFDASGRPGAPALRDRQQALRVRRHRGPPGLRTAERGLWYPGARDRASWYDHHHCARSSARSARVFASADALERATVALPHPETSGCSPSERLLILAAHAAGARRLERERLAAGLRPAVEAAYETCGYRRCGGRWAGGGHSLCLLVGAPSARGETTRAWSANGKWRGNDSAHYLAVAPDWATAVGGRGLAVVSGMLTLSAEPTASLPLRQGEEALEATWVRQGRGIGLVAERGLLYRPTPDGAWSHASSLRAARAQHSRSASAGLRARAARAAARGELDLRLAVRVAASCGLCRPGVLDWAERHFPGRERVTLEEFRAAVAATSDRANQARAVLAALDALTAA